MLFAGPNLFAPLYYLAINISATYIFKSRQNLQKKILRSSVMQFYKWTPANDTMVHLNLKMYLQDFITHILNTIACTRFERNNPTMQVLQYIFSVCPCDKTKHQNIPNNSTENQ